jgi:hypothetical protein
MGNLFMSLQFRDHLGGARFARIKGGNVVHFSAKPKNEPPLLPLCERSEHKVH